MLRNLKYRIVPMLMIIALMAPFFVYAYDVDLTELSLEELMDINIYGASRFEQKITDAPSFVSVVTADEIKKFGFRTVGDILGSLPGFYVDYDRDYQYIGSRGFLRPGDYNSRYLVLVNGHRMNDNIYGSTLTGTDFILDIDLIDRVEVVRGPSSSVYGSQAFLGVIDVVTKRGALLDGAQASGSVGSFESYNGRLSYGKRFGNGFEMLVSSSAYDSNGDALYFREYDDPSTQNGVFRGGDYDRNGSTFAMFSYGGFTLTGAFNRRTKGVPITSSDADMADTRRRTIDERGYLDLRYGAKIDDTTTMKARAFYDHYRYEGRFPYDGIMNVDYSKGRWWGGEIMLMKELFNKHKVILGAEYYYNDMQLQRNYDEYPFFSYLDDNKKSHNWAVYLQDEFTILSGLILNTGVRYDYNKFIGSMTSPRLALIYNPFQRTTLKFIYGTSFRAPSICDLFYDDMYWYKANSHLKPETIKSYELVYEQQLWKRNKFILTGYYNSIGKIIGEWDDPSDGLTQSVNRERVEVKGLEAMLQGTVDPGIKGSISYTFSDARDKDTKRTLVNSPRHMLKLGLIIPLLKDRLFSGLETQYLSKRKTYSGGTTGGSFVTNLTFLNQKLVKGLEMSFSIYNLFDKKYSHPAESYYRMDAIEQDGRTFRFKLTYGF